MEIRGHAKVYLEGWLCSTQKKNKKNEHSDNINEDIYYLMGFDIRHNTQAHTPEQNSLYLDCNNDNNNEDYNLDTDNNNTTSESNCHILNNYECDDDSDDDVTFNDDIVLNL